MGWILGEMQGRSACERETPSGMRVKNTHATSPSRMATEGGKAPGPVASTGEAGGGGSRSETEGASASVHGLALAEAVLLAQMLDVSAGAGLEAHAGAAVVFKATCGVGPVFGRGE